MTPRFIGIYPVPEAEATYRSRPRRGEQSWNFRVAEALLILVGLGQGGPAH